MYIDVFQYQDYVHEKGTCMNALIDFIVYTAMFNFEVCSSIYAN